MRAYKWNKYGVKITINIEVPFEVVNGELYTYLGTTNWIDKYSYLGTFDDCYRDLQSKQCYISLFDNLNRDLREIYRILYQYESVHVK